MSDRRYPRVDIKLEALNTEAGTTIVVVRLRNPLWGKSKFVANVHNFERLLELSQQIYKALNSLVKHSPSFDRVTLRDPMLAGPLEELNARLYGMHLDPHGKPLGELMTEVMQGVALPVISVNELIGLVPWEITSPFVDTPQRMLGGMSLLYGSLARDPESGTSTRAKVGSVIDAGFPTMLFDHEIVLHAAGDTSITFASDEEAYIVKPKSYANGLLAPAINSRHDEAAFFAHFKERLYHIVHFFCHCANKENGFAVSVNQGYSLGEVAFYKNNAIFKPQAFHFLNVCDGAPTPRTRSKSLVGYMDRQQIAGGIVASLVSVRSRTALDMAEAFYEYFLPDRIGQAGNSVAYALFTARNNLWRKDLAAGYLYRSFGRHDTYFTPAKNINS